VGLQNRHYFFFRSDRPKSTERSNQKTIRERSLHKLLIEAVTCEVYAPNASVKKRIRKLGIEHGHGVRQGMPLSPFFANLFLHPLDLAIERENLNAVRYADDLIFFADTEEQCHQIFNFCKDELKPLNLQIPGIGANSKSEIYLPLQPAEFLGLGLCLINGKYELRLMGAQIERIRTDLLQLGSIPELLSRKVTLAFLGNSLRSRVSGYLSAYEACSNILELENTLTDIHQKVLRRIYTEGLKIELSTLSGEARTFLGLR
jgi:RNA-directed DNA polymerase